MNFCSKISPYKKFLKYLLFIFVIFVLFFAWKKNSWVFYPKAVFRYLTYQFENAVEEEKKLLETQSEQSQIKRNETQEFKKENSIEIPKIQISAPLVLVENESEVKKALDRGVVLWPNSSLPGQKGQTIILGHSAPPNWPKIKYDWVFSDLNKLEVGDEIFVYFEKKEFKYSVSKKIFLEKGGEIPKENVLVLISCWPPGKDLRRIAVLADQNIDK